MQPPTDFSPTNQSPVKPFRRFTAPENLSIFGNSEQSLGFFSDIVGTLSEKGLVKNNLLYIDMENVKNITIDSIMYLIAIMKNARLRPNAGPGILFKGNFPKDDEAHRMLNDSGFLKFVHSQKARTPKPNSDYFQIITGSDADPMFAQQVCDYVSVKLPAGTNIRFLYWTILELIANTKEHAYKVTGVLEIPNWYIFVENSESKFKFTLIDTGESIPATVAKSARENAMSIMNKGDGNLIYSAIKGENRTSTKKPHRGIGLPGVFEFCKVGLIQNFKIISRNGFFESNSTDVNAQDNRQTLIGTLFYWEVLKPSPERSIDYD